MIAFVSQQFDLSAAAMQRTVLGKMQLQDFLLCRCCHVATRVATIDCAVAENCLKKMKKKQFIFICMIN